MHDPEQRGALTAHRSIATATGNISPECSATQHGDEACMMLGARKTLEPPPCLCRHTEGAQREPPPRAALRQETHQLPTKRAGSASLHKGVPCTFTYPRASSSCVFVQKPHKDQPQGGSSHACPHTFDRREGGTCLCLQVGALDKTKAVPQREVTQTGANTLLKRGRAEYSWHFDCVMNDKATFLQKKLLYLRRFNIKSIYRDRILAF